MTLTKYLCHALTIKDALDDEIYTLAYFHKDSVTSCNKKKNLENNVIIEKDCDN